MRKNGWAEGEVCRNLDAKKNALFCRDEGICVPEYRHTVRSVNPRAFFSRARLDRFPVRP